MTLEVPGSASEQASNSNENFLSSPVSNPARSPTPESNRVEVTHPRKTPMPLSDITTSAINEHPSPRRTVKPAPMQDLPAVPLRLHHSLNPSIKYESQQPPALPTLVEPPKQRMAITHLVLTNFKSYAGRQEVGPFHATFSSVVGPNGSGKSNVIDSLLFVFGFRASKMRQGRISELIHHSAAYPDVPSCEVEVCFAEVLDLADGSLETIPGSEISISRRAFRNNSSKYFINNVESNFTTVTAFLRDKGIDLDHKRFLILQGEVESIAQMKPKAANEHEDGLLEYLEDIIGTSKYKVPIEESAAEADALNNVCIEKTTRMAHVEKEKAALEAKKDLALAQIRKENELHVKRAILLQICIAEGEDLMDVDSNALEHTRALLDDEIVKHEQSENEIALLDNKYGIDVQHQTHLEQTAQNDFERAAKADKNHVKLEEQNKHLKRKIEKLEKAITSSNMNISEASEEMKTLHDTTVLKTKEAQLLETQLVEEERTLESMQDSLRGKTDGLTKQIEERQRLLDPWINQIDQKQAKITLARSECTMLQEKAGASAKAVGEAEERLRQYVDQRSAKTNELDKSTETIDSLEKGTVAMESTLDQIRGTQAADRLKIASARQMAVEARSSLASSQSQGDVLTSLVRLKSSGRLSGFHGRLGNLGFIDNRFDIAISTACPALEHLVVDSVEIGQQCIEHLRRYKLGRASFIVLDRLTGQDFSSIETPENAPRLFDLVKTQDSKFRPAFYSVLQNTLVATDLQQAERIAYGSRRWRVVTLAGQLIDKSGAMSGGGNRISKGGMSAKIMVQTSIEQVEQLEANQLALEKDHAKIHRQREELESSIKQNRESILLATTNAQRIRLAIKCLSDAVSDAKDRLSELKSLHPGSNNDQDRLQELHSIIDRVGEEIQEVSVHADRIKDEVEALQDRIMDIGGVQFRQQKAICVGLRSRLEVLAQQVSDAQLTQIKVDKQKNKHEQSLMSSTKGRDEIAGDICSIEQNLRLQRLEVDNTKHQAAESQKTFEAGKDSLTRLKLDIQAKKAMLQDARSAELNLRNKFEAQDKSLSEARRRQQQWQSELQGLSLQRIGCEFGEDLGYTEIPVHSRDELADFRKEDLRNDIDSLAESAKTHTVDTQVLDEYRRRVEEHASRSSDLATAISARDEAREHCENMRKQRLNGFMEGFTSISLRLKEMYQMITMGGNAELELVDSLDPFSEGILFSVMPPKKSWKNISNLSGGEKTLSSLALVFALHHYKPTPLYVMDEIDAALDFKNVSIVANYIKERTKNAQFIVISLRNNMFELASRLVGVYKVNHMV